GASVSSSLARRGGFDCVVGGGPRELVLVSGYSGVGKSSVVNELHRALVPPRGLFASGKFDQVKRDIPYATLAQAFQSLVRSLLGKSDAELASWRVELQKALAPNGRLMTDLIPELALVIGDLQWLDGATLDFLEDVLTRSKLRHLLLIGAYRDNEVDDGSPLMRRL